MASRSSLARPVRDSAAVTSGSRRATRSLRRGRRRNLPQASTPLSPRTCPLFHGTDRPCTSAPTGRVRRARFTSQRATRSSASPETKKGRLTAPLPFLLQVVLELSAPRWVTQLAQRLRFDLSDALTSHVELAAHLFERAGAPVLETEPQLQHASLAAGQPFEDGLDLLLEELVRCGVARGEGLVVGDEVPEVRILFLADRRLERDGLLRNLHDLAHLVGGDEHPLRDLFGGRLAAQVPKGSPLDAGEVVDRPRPVDRD